MSDEWFVTMPKLGETVTEGELTTWLKNVGDPIAFDDPLFEVSTDKVDSEIPSPYDGVLAEILVPAGQTVPIGTQLARIVPEGASVAPVEGRLPETGHHVAAAGGPALGDGAAPQMGGSEGPADEAPGVSAPAGLVHDITMPKLGETVTEGELTSWLKNVGDAVEMDDPLFEVSTDKVDSEIPSPYDGVLLEILVQAGQTVPIGTPVARIGEAGASVGAPAAAPTASGSASAGPSSSTATTIVIGSKAEPGRMLSPLVRRLAAENNLDVSALTGTGEGGRIRREDVEKAIAGGGARTNGAAAPAARAATAPAPAAPAAAPATTAPRPAVPAGVADPRDEVVTLSRMRIAVANGMVASLAASASVWTSVEVDFDNVEKVRVKHKDRFKKETGASLSYLPFVSRATIDALRAFPTVNSSIDIEAKTMTLHPYVNLGIAVDLDQQGLVVPVVKDADSLNMRGVARKITELAGAARSKKLGAEDMKGSTFTITNPGPFASYASSPIINQPNVAILCTDGVKRRPVAVGDAIAIHPTGIIGLVYDHRAFDGSTASLFLMHIRDSLEQRDWEAEVG
ncbi:2-oxo acid dehydrogenase subunit E2 [Nakamurella multipartita]|uniref:Dihydrolipoamide acetyltransferase component of pyruvate dehydrogenase complex n=1 Tax=Nakamurella multipartita (strain ATCC 700099 / DSM 44233 / CIP 104796 / JCM 9543 / NBRC 105858 / Y-104) TaxID=479431 RepID=C8XHU3_NAKMY|nr:2-oxo acid dehydrogenase subunit E2 [Nakamurella multipartita]ACV80396.1 2-oxoglutarate dehydrogenase, E2 component, dihydrolipoamide succinyltransferase [Nakamurella multipartita DSM 44233]